MKKFFSLTALLSAALLLSACGGAGDVNEDTDPYALKSEKLQNEGWEEAFSAQENYCVKTVLTNSPTKKEGTMSEVTTMDFCNDGERAYFSMCVKEGDTTVYEAESYADLTDKKAIWSRSKEDGDWSEWDSETYTSEQFAEFFKGFLPPAFARDASAAFTYSESENGYTMSEDGLSENAEALGGYVDGVLSCAPSFEEGMQAEKFVLKFTDGKPSACLFELTSGTDAPGEADEARSAHIPPIPHPYPMPHIHITRHGTVPRIIILLPKVERIRPAREAAPAHVACSQLFYGYGKARVTLPSDLPPLSES